MILIPVKKDAQITSVPADNALVMRYMSLKRFEQIIIDQTIFFPSYHSLDDYYEMTIEDPKYRRMIEEDRKYFAISCWSLHEYEQYSLWVTYLRGKKKGIAICTTYHDLCKSFEKFKYEITPGLVQYQNDLNRSILLRDTKESKRINFHRYLFFKKKFFQTDRELRLVRYNFTPKGMIPILETVGKGISIECDLEKLIHSIILSPFTKRKIVKKVQKILTENGLNKVEIKESEIKIK